MSTSSLHKSDIYMLLSKASTLLFISPCFILFVSLSSYLPFSFLKLNAEKVNSKSAVSVYDKTKNNTSLDFHLGL